MVRLIVSLILLSSLVFANTKVYEQTLVGEKDIQHYYGPSFPKVSQSLNDGNLSWNEHEVSSPLLESIFFSNSSELERFFTGELSAGIQCPNEYLHKHIDYIRYVYRLITISYLYEAINNYQVALDLLRQNKKCRVNWVKVFKKSCKPKGADMKKYVSNLLKVNKFFSSNVEMLGSNREFIMDWYQKFYSERDTTIAHTRLLSHCYTTGQNCKDYPRKKVMSTLNQVCVDDLNLLKNICSEEDDIYGLSYVMEASELINKSNVVNVFNFNSMARGCLSRYSQMMAYKESNYDFLIDIFPMIYEQLEQNFGASYIQGKLFVSGSFKEFEDKGLASVYENEIKKAVSVPKKEKKKVEKKEELIVVSDAKIVIKQKRKKQKVVKKKVNKPKPKKIKKTAFLLAVERLHRNKLPFVNVNMNKFKYDYIFTFGTLKKLKISLKSYMSYTGLEEMKKYDYLGKQKAPIPLVFLKYMIDTNQHHGLYNIINVIGDRFYVINTIDKNNPYKSSLVELKNDNSTNNKWQITVLDDSKSEK